MAVRKRPEEAEFRAMCREMTAREIAERVGVSRVAVYRWAKELGCKPKADTAAAPHRPSREEFEDLIARYTHAEIAALKGVTRAAVRQWAAYYDLEMISSEDRQRWEERRRWMRRSHHLMPVIEPGRLGCRWVQP